ncbi:hypothetical protein EUGRSUZ_G00365 [Eucalyptus grandis]|uniref:Uncharacterized protein n=2 Tax=Eucalyptus grandis TaxID=71139 RepID=A0ACC3K0D5_EUCGR|nr:hypothetical protein EUGRSUZ_G00365 [Eucalyptus grandis]
MALMEVPSMSSSFKLPRNPISSGNSCTKLQNLIFKETKFLSLLMDQPTPSNVEQCSIFSLSEFMGAWDWRFS